jgi:hypothetical protein
MKNTTITIFFLILQFVLLIIVVIDLLITKNKLK